MCRPGAGPGTNRVGVEELSFQCQGWKGCQDFKHQEERKKTLQLSRDTPPSICRHFLIQTYSDRHTGAQCPKEETEAQPAGARAPSSSTPLPAGLSVHPSIIPSFVRSFSRPPTQPTQSVGDRGVRPDADAPG